jgi:hypothetical protein
MNKKLGIKHLIECHCTLKIYQKSEKTIYHKFPVYTKFEKSGAIIPKIAQCNNCKTLHRVYDICKSEIIPGGKDTDNSMIKIEDMELQLSSKLFNFLTKQKSDISTYEYILDIIETKSWGTPVVLSREIIDLDQHAKILIIENEDKFKIKKIKFLDEIKLGD